ncbi:c-type cytochrome biogenesis protein CcsB [Micromonospora polyrhachis]|uniref:Cytochrome c-type biogenesis protein CcsB n=1 Tax=Micromonospora polyrhachis TaxID=1282883 RepID=A0A7W7SPL7_9ACTN|nr:c-type cytochrome biogenesis protein CcsB [Micromonospora polyrhachis]MBB4958630.1 cytochrome c-type biogenesis protein CcsB [Micromonospora polyrhachis]
MAALSDQLLVVAIMAYLVAMICHAAEYAFGNRSALGRAAIRPARELVGVGARTGDGGVKTGEGDPKSAGTDSPPTKKGRDVLLGRAAVVVTAVAALVHLAVLVTRGIAADRMPWGNMYEFVLTGTFVGVVAWLFMLYRHPTIRHLGLFVALVMVLLLGLAGLVLYTPVVPLVPALNSYWFIIHISTITISSGIFVLGAVPATMYLIRSGYEQGKRSFPYTLGRRVPAAAELERLTFRLHAFSFPIWTFAVIAGAIWAEAAWGRYWGWDPKEIWAFISWVVYAGYLHARATPSVKRSVATWIAIIGFLTMLVNLFGVNFFSSDSLHSYASVE